MNDVGEKEIATLKRERANLRAALGRLMTAVSAMPIDLPEDLGQAQRAAYDALYPKGRTVEAILTETPLGVDEGQQ